MHTLSKLYANVIGMLIPIIIITISGILYRTLHGATLDFELSYSLFTILIIVSIITHELIHGLVWSVSCKQYFKSIVFGINGFMPFFHCSETLDCNKYLIGVLMPFLVLGIGLSFVGFVISNMWVMLTAVVNILIAGGDILIALELRKSTKAKIFDHPTDAGFIAFKKNP